MLSKASHKHTDFTLSEGMAAEEADGPRMKMDMEKPFLFFLFVLSVVKFLVKTWVK